MTLQWQCKGNDDRLKDRLQFMMLRLLTEGISKQMGSQHRFKGTVFQQFCSSLEILSRLEEHRN